MPDGAVHEAIAAVLSELPAIGKNRNAPANMGGYAFRSIEDITSALKPLLAKHGLTVIPTVLDRHDSERSTSGNKVMFVTDLHVQFSFVAADGSTLVASMWGQGTDMGDKATQKAVTAAFKSMLAVTFCISDASDDAEAHVVPETERPKAAPKGRIEEVRALAADASIGDWVKEHFEWPWTAASCDAIEKYARARLEAPFDGEDVGGELGEGEVPDSPSTSEGEDA